MSPRPTRRGQTIRHDVHFEKFVQGAPQALRMMRRHAAMRMRALPAKVIFFTMPRSDLQQEVAPFVVNVDEFSIAPHTTEIVAATCPTFGGKVVTMMPHTHKLAQRFTVDLISPNNVETRVFDDGAFDLESDIRRFEPALDIDGAQRIRHECTFVNTRDVEVHYGIGKNEMCTFFGYIYPPEKQFVGTVSEDGGPCSSIQIGLFR